jgi:hypothetical protein
MVIDVEDLDKRVDKMQRQKEQETWLSLKYLQTQRSLKKLKKQTANMQKMFNACCFKVKNRKKQNPIFTKCRIKKCIEKSQHGHIEIPKITRSICQVIIIIKQQDLLI